MINLDGSQGEGGGQILRTSLTLSMITGTPFRVTNIRANRAKPGLMRQHLVAVQAAAEVCGAEVSHAEVGSSTLEFRPGRIKAGNYKFAIGTAGSSTLVLQTLLPALLYANEPSTVLVSGGTHNPMAPPVQFLQRAYGRVLEMMGANVDIQLRRYGFYPAGGGEVLASIEPCPELKQITLTERGKLRSGYAEAIVAGLPVTIARRELDQVSDYFGWFSDQLHIIEPDLSQGPGNALLITFDNEHVTEVFTAIGEKRVSLVEVAAAVIGEADEYRRSKAAVGEHLADQVMLPMALAGGGSFTMHRVSQHALTNAEVIKRFLPVDITLEEQGDHAVCVIGTHRG